MDNAISTDEQHFRKQPSLLISATTFWFASTVRILLTFVQLLRNPFFKYPKKVKYRSNIRKNNTLVRSVHFDHLCSHELLGTDELVYLISSEAFFDRFVKLRKNFVKNIFVKLKKSFVVTSSPLGPPPRSLAQPTTTNAVGRFVVN